MPFEPSPKTWGEGCRNVMPSYQQLLGIRLDAGYAARVLECFGHERVLYGSDWPVLTLAGDYGTWYGFTERFTRGWSVSERSRFYGGNAARVYDL